MKKSYPLLIFALSIFLVNNGYSQITGSAHDFSGQAIWNPQGEICIVCHTPHNADATIADAPLWNHASTAQDYTGLIYTSTTFDAVNPANLPDGSSKLCLSCHDGTIAVNNFTGGTGTPVFIGAISAGADLGADLRDDHPISFDYADSNTDSEIKPAGSTTLIGNDITTDYLIGGKVQCASCHDVHNNGTGASLLKISNTGSQLCLECHAK